MGPGAAPQGAALAVSNRAVTNVSATAMLRSLTFSFAVLAYTSSVAFAVPCTQVALKPDQSSIVLQGKTTGSDTDFTCFQLTTGIGRQLHLKLIQAAGPTLAFNIDDVIDSRDDYSFVTGRDSYKIEVHGGVRVSPVQPFQISVAASPGADRGGLGDPAATVSTVVKLDRYPSSIFDFSEKPSPLMQKYFTADFVAAWVAAMRHNKEGPVLDGDPLTWLQGVKSVTLKSSQTDLITFDRATVTARVVAQPDGSTFSKPEGSIIHFDLKRENTAWKIDDIYRSGQQPLRDYLRRVK